MSCPIIVPAPSLSCGIGRQFGLSGRPGSRPLVSINLSTALAETLTADILRPYAEPGHAVVGLSPSSETFKVIAYLVVPIPFGTLITINDQVVGDDVFLVLGTEAAIPMDGITSFITAKQEHGRFLLTCGDIISPALPQRPRPDRWSLELTTIYGADAGQQVQSAVNRLRRQPRRDLN